MMYMLLNKNKISYILISLSLLFLLYVIFKSEIYFLGEKRSYYQVYYYLSFFFIFISVSHLFFSDKFKVYFNIIIVTLFLGIYFLELSIQIYKINFNNKFEEIFKKQTEIRKINYKKETGNEYDER